MTNAISTLSEFGVQQKVKSFWSRPEGKVGIVVAGLLLFATYKWVFPYVLGFLTGTIQIIVFGAILSLLVVLLLDPQVHAIVWNGYKSIMRALAIIFVNMDPVGIMKNYVQHLYDQISTLVARITDLQGSDKYLQRIIDSNNEEIEQNKNLALVGKKQKMSPAEIAVYTMQVGRLEAQNQKYLKLQTKIRFIIRVLDKMKDAARIITMDTNNKVKMLEQERKVSRKVTDALKAAFNVIFGDRKKREMFDMAVESVENDIAMRDGAFEQFMLDSESAIKKIDLQNGVYEEEGMKLLEKWENEGLPALLTGVGTTSIQDAQFTMVDNRVPVPVNNSYADLIANKPK